MKSISIRLRIVEIILFILLIQGAFVAVVALLGILFAVIGLSLTGILEAVAAVIALPLLIVPGIVLWFWFRVQILPPDFASFSLCQDWPYGWPS